MSKKLALIFGITGQDGSYLAELLLEKGYDVHGLVRRSSGYVLPNIEHIRGSLTIHYGDLETENQLSVLIAELLPDEVYALAAQSDVAISFETPEYTGNITGLGATRILESIRHFSPHSKIYQASSSEQFGDAPPPQNELTPFKAKSPYGAAKIYAHHMAVNYRESYGMFICCGILFNHESERRGVNFVTRKISNAAARIKLGKQDVLELGNMEAKRDWGYAPDYVEAMWLMLQQDEPDDYVIGTGITHSIIDFAQAAFDYLDLDWRQYVLSNTPIDMRPSEVNLLMADARKAKGQLGWIPKTGLAGLVRIMVDHDMEANK